MIESHYPTINELASEQRTRRNLLALTMLIVLALVCGAMCGLAYFFPRMSPVALTGVGLAVFACLVVPVVIWNNPVRGLYLLLIGVMLLGNDIPRPTMPTAYIPFWSNISTIGQNSGTNAFNALVFSPAELIMILATLTWSIRAIVRRDTRLHAGAFFWPIAAYSLMVFYGWVHGMTTGGDSTMALYEVRAQAHFLLGYLMGVNLIRTRREVIPLFYIIVLGAGLLGIFGVLTYAAIGSGGENGFMVHDNSLLFNMLFFLAMLAPLLRLDKRLQFAAYLLLPCALFSQMANQRRAGIAAFIIGFVPLLPLSWAVMKERRTQIARFSVFFAFLSAIYLPIAWNGNGIWALPARAIRSQSSPDARDASSDYYRLAEAANLKFTRDLQPWTGIGYGKVFAQVYALPQVTTNFLQFMPHNSVLWVWMRIGNIGFFLFWMMIATVMIRGPQILKEVNDPYLKAAGIFAILSLIMVYTFGKYDMVLVNSRQMFTTALFIGVLSRLPQLDKQEEETSREVV